ncbi:flagellar hook-associated protein FlgL [Legionella micdadei]|nr:flagellar hook-associated protein FlgL [Legionella micdadei]ARG97783.1 flagellar hook-associated protein 3 [Legionella micdadei]ARG99900.1 flagellar hook-associated protein 3 [Legionella micdadei]KTD28494.1 flagellar hook-associated protein FlgL [Legionella micdadei]NSL18737.1 flagellar hook-associated protein FlgL [Legionella micdadei]SCX83436.1 flagellar hook-associated protein 3 FlgL [Legionella micdadei]
MRISTTQIFLQGLNGVLAQQAETLKLQQQLSSQKKIQSPADDPIGAAQIELMMQRINLTENMEKNRESAVSEISYEESILSNVINVIQRLRELQVQSGNTALSEGDREAMSEEAKNLLDQLVDLGNAQDSNGYYLFSGSKTSTQPFTLNAGQYIYNGDQTQRSQIISSGLQIAVNDNGNDIFMRIPNGNGTFTVTQTSTPNTGTVAATTGSVIDPAAYVVDNYTVNFVLNSLNQMVVMVTGASTGPIIPSTGLPDDAPLYQDGGTINFNGVQVTFHGTPNAGDSFAVNPSRNESIFSTAVRIVANLKQSFSTAADKAAVETENNQLLEQLDSALNNILAFRAQVGARLNQLDVAAQVNNDVLEISEETLHTVQDVNLAEAAVKLNLQQVYLQAAQQSFARIQGLTVFNYI